MLAGGMLFWTRLNLSRMHSGVCPVTLIDDSGQHDKTDEL
jgi:hypothetical protein